MQQAIRPIRPYRDNYDDVPGPDHLIVKALRGELAPRITRLCDKSGPNATVLDAGCGRQPFRRMLESRGLQYRSQDVIQNSDGTVQHICPLDGPLDPELVSLAPFDVILCTEVLEHVADWPRAFGNLASLLRPGGTLLISCPHVYVLHEEPFDYWRPTLHGLRYYAERYGFQIVDARQLGGAWEVIGTLLGHTQISARRRRLVNRAASLLTRKAISLVVRGIRSGWLQSILKADCPTYLSNVVEMVRDSE